MFLPILSITLGSSPPLGTSFFLPMIFIVFSVKTNSVAWSHPGKTAPSGELSTGTDTCCFCSLHIGQKHTDPVTFINREIKFQQSFELEKGDAGIIVRLKQNYRT